MSRHSFPPRTRRVRAHYPNVSNIVVFDKSELILPAT